MALVSIKIGADMSNPGDKLPCGHLKVNHETVKENVDSIHMRLYCSEIGCGKHWRIYSIVIEGGTE